MLDHFTRSAMFEPSTFNAEKRTISLVFTTGADVRRRDFEGEFLERLAVTPEAVDLSALPGAPVLDAHNRWSVRDIIGVVQDAAIQGGRGVATIRLGERSEVAGLAQDIAGGVIRAVSAGYVVEKWELSKAANGQRIKTATRWKPVELSFAPLVADGGAVTRSSQGVESNMTLQEEFRQIANAIHVPVAFADELATRNLPLAEGRDALFQEARRLVPVLDPRPPATVTRDGGADIRVRMADGLRARFNRAHTPSEGGREFAHMSMVDLARRCLVESGQSSFGAGPQLLLRAMTTSDFSAILMEAFNKELLVLQTAPSPVAQIFKRATVTDYRKRHVMELSQGTALQKVNEAGEVKYGSITDKELASYKPDPWGLIYPLTIQVLQNDDMGALSDFAGQLVSGTRQWFNSFLVDVILSNPKLADGKSVFHADHANLAATGAPPSDVTITAAKLAMRKQLDLSGNPINATPRFILAPAALEGAIDKLLAELYPQQPDQAAVSARTLTPLIEARLDAEGQAAAWYLFADPVAAPVFEYAEIDGSQGPQVDVEQGFDMLGTKWRVIWSVGAGAIDSRGGFKNPGV